jgi:hypothetical protein
VTFDIRILVWFFLILALLTILQRRLHFEIQACLLLITRRVDLSLVVFSILFLPGVIVHEASHYFAAKITGVRTGRVSLLPEIISDGRLRMGYVETEKTDFIRDAIIGLAPLISGMLIISLILFSLLNFSVPILPEEFSNISQIFTMGTLLMAQPDFWLWFYVVFVISSTMFPSNSDRRAWFPIIALGIILMGFGLILGAGPWLLENIVPSILNFLRIITFVLGICALVHFGLLIPFWVLRQFLTRLTSLRVV